MKSGRSQNEKTPARLLQRSKSSRSGNAKASNRAAPQQMILGIIPPPV
jgi:hypothetical protein